jgi:hypothetical protein
MYDCTYVPIPSFILHHVVRTCTVHYYTFFFSYTLQRENRKGAWHKSSLYLIFWVAGWIVCNGYLCFICFLHLSVLIVTDLSASIHLSIMVVTDPSNPSVCDDCQWPIFCLYISLWWVPVCCLSIFQCWLSLIYLLIIHLPVMIVTGLSAAYLSVNDQSAAFPSVCDMSVANKGERAGDRPTGRLCPSPDSSRYCLATQLSYCSTEYLQT